MPRSPVRRASLPIMAAAGMLGLVIATTLVGSIVVLPTRPSPSQSPAPSDLAEPAILVGAGDIADCSSHADSLTAELVAGTPGTVFTLGDNAPIGRRRDYRVCYAETWGAELDRTRPAVGNQDYVTDHGRAYYDYFGKRAGTAGYYSYDVKKWHVVVLNSECDQIGGCELETAWLAADLASHPSECTLAYWHRPLLSAVGTPDADDIRPFWQALYHAGAELVLNGHFQAYQRFAPLDPNLQPDAKFGIRQIIAGTGGNQSMLLNGDTPHVEVQGRAQGVLILRLYPGRYEWEFVPIRGQSFRDSGSGECHGAPPA
jgi:hypothetical protein